MSPLVAPRPQPGGVQRQAMALNGDDFARRLRAVTGNLTQVEIASLVGVTQQDVSRYLRGRIPKAENLLKLADTFGVSVSWLLTGRKPAAPTETARVRKPLHPARRGSKGTVLAPPASGVARHDLAP